MEEFKRDFFKTDPVLNKLYLIIKKNHKVARHTAKVLSENLHIKDFCEESRHFVELPGKTSLYIHYDVSSWGTSEGVRIRIDSIGVYDDFIEYQIARAKMTEGTTLN